MRTITLPDGVDGENMPMEVKDEILQVTRPMAAAFPKKIPLKKGTPPMEVENESCASNLGTL